MARTFQNIRLFGNMTALENVMVGRYCRTTTGPFTSIIRGPKFRRDEAATTARAQELLDFVGLRADDRQSGPQSSLRRSAPAGDRPGPGHRPQVGPAGRADRRHEPAGDPAGRGPDLQDPRPGTGRRRDRARHAVHLQPLRPGALPRPGPDVDRRHAGGGPVRPARDRGLHRHRSDRVGRRDGERRDGRTGRRTGQRIPETRR